MSKEKLYIFDTTLRDGAQTQGVDFSIDDKEKISLALDNLGDVYVSPKYKVGNKNGNSGREERMVVLFHSMNPESPLGYKKEGLVTFRSFSFNRNCWDRFCCNTTND